MRNFEELFCVETAPMPAVVVIFGATGDLAQRKLFPALRNLHDRQLFNESSMIIACGRRPFTDESFRAVLGGDGDFLRHIKYCCGDNNDSGFYQKLKDMISAAESNCSDYVCNILFYLSLSPDDMLSVCSNLASNGMLQEENNGSWKHIVLEKPFGSDLESAQLLNCRLHELMNENQIYRIDHYLGKETVQNIMMLRFANVIFEPLWRSEYIQQVEITAAETLGVERRGKYYDRAGALRDMFQNHMLQLLALTAMEVPISFDADAVRDEKVKLLRSIRPFDLEKLDSQLVRGQYVAGNDLIGYRQEADVATDSVTETYVAAEIMIDNWRWRNVPFFLRSGKRLAHKKSEIAITFKAIPHSIFPGIAPEYMHHNVLTLQIFPTEGITLSLQAKKPGPKLCVGSMQLNFDYASLGKSGGDDAYERLLLDALLGDPTLFIRSDFIEESWKLLTPVLKKWAENVSAPEFYPAGSEGPEGGRKLIAPAVWRPLAVD
ncbi:MAG: glucose-6-phosphate dehydrogenase [Lentisphaerae bacterium]|nr:glucose-6-phosphate dehydrogenase [Lentisphaerota bacterium]